ncbi:MAG: VWA domain-containing protein [Polyangia bacterium]
MAAGLVFAGLSAGAVVALGVSGGVALTTLYLLQPRRRRVVVPFVGLWLSSPGDSLADRLGRRLRRFASFALQLTILGLVLLAAGDVHRRGEQAAARSVLILIDRSASMQATDEAGSRLERARTLARQIIAGLGQEDRALVATFGGEVWPLTGLESDHGRLADAVDGVSASDETGDLAGALSSLSVEAPLLRGHPHPTAVVISDFAGGGQAGATWQAFARALGPEIAPTFVSVGRRRNNVGIVAFSGRRLSADPSSVEAELVLAAQSFRDTPSEVTLTITAGPQRTPVARRMLRLEAGARAVTTFSDLAVADDRLQAVLEDTGDDLALDDRAYAVLPRAPPVTVLVVGDRNLYLEGALLGLEISGALRVDRLSAAALEASRTRWAAHDLVIFDGVTPQPAPSAGAFLYLDPHGPGNPWPERAGEVADPVVTNVLRAHPLLQQVSLSDLNVTAARRLTLRPGDLAVAAAAQQALIVARSGPTLRQVAVAFDIRRSDLPLRSAFPLFIANSISWLSRQTPPAPLSFVAGATARIPVPPERGALSGDQVEVRLPEGRVLRVPVIDDVLTVSLAHVGLVAVRDLKGRVLVHAAVNLASAAESDLGPRTPPVGRQQQDPPGVVGDGAPAPTRRPWWVAMVLVALALALLEWVTFHRRLTV